MNNADLQAAAAAARLANAKPAASADIKEGEEVGEQTFHNLHPGSSFVMPNGDVHVFDYKGELKTKDAKVAAELKAIADKPGSPVYFKNAQATPAPVDKQAFRDVKANAEAVVEQLQKQGAK